jgi:DivIVA domain-containing protein
MPEDRLVSITSSSHLVPDDVARHTFGSVRRGFDPGEVRAYLESIGIGLRSIAEREGELLRVLAEAEHRAAHPVLDEAALTDAVGAETARVLHSAHEVAAEMEAKAKAEAERVLSEANQEAEETRARIESLVGEQTDAAQAAAEDLRQRTNQQITAGLDAARHEADELLSTAREQCRAMVEEAQELRSRVLADLAKRRKVLHAQIEQLRAGRERLTQTVDDARRSVEAIAQDLFAAEDNARVAAEDAGRTAAARPDEGTPEEMASLLLAAEAEAAEADTAEADTAEQGEPAGVEVNPPASEVHAVDPSTAPSSEPMADGDPGSSGDADPGPAAGSTPETGDDPTPVDELFARIRAQQDDTEGGSDSPASDTTLATEVPEAGTEAVAAANENSVPTDEGEEGAGSEDQPPDDRHPAAIQRDQMIEPIVSSLARRLKRTLQDSQNELLDNLRSHGSSWSADLLPAEVEQVDSLATAALPTLEEAAEAGVSFAGNGSGQPPRTDLLVGIAHELAESVVGPLRRRLADEQAAQVDADEAAAIEHVGAAFREWKGERVERLAGDHVVAAFSAGTLAAVEAEPGQLEWVAVAIGADPPCPDCEDNGLSGSQQPGEKFPTGHLRPPAHPGCRCLLARSAT